MDIKASSPAPEFSFLLPVDKISAAGFVKAIDASESERRHLAARFGLLNLPKLRADLTAQLARAGKAVQVTGTLVADVVQKCGVTNEPVPDHIESVIDVFYTSEIAEEETQGFVDPAEAEIEPIINGVIDLGELVAQNLGIALNPYPRKTGAVFEAVADEKAPILNSPMAKLVELTNKGKDNSKG